jgi:isocitrate dehydrogenase
MTSVFAWTGALEKRGQLDDLPELGKFAKALESATVDTIESGVATSDLTSVCEPRIVKAATLDKFLEGVGRHLQSKLA